MHLDKDADVKQWDSAAVPVSSSEDGTGRHAAHACNDITTLMQVAQRRQT